MNYFILIFLMISSASFLSAQNVKPVFKSKGEKDLLLVEASCGQCQFKMEGKSCDLAFRIKGKLYFVDGTHIDGHGDAHAKNGFCEKIRKAEVRGSVVNNRFQVSYFKLLPEKHKQ